MTVSDGPASEQWTTIVFVCVVCHTACLLVQVFYKPFQSEKVLTEEELNAMFINWKELRLSSMKLMKWVSCCCRSLAWCTLNRLLLSWSASRVICWYACLLIDLFGCIFLSHRVLSYFEDLSSLISPLLYPAPIGWGHYATMADVCLSVCASP